ncbi:phage tail family protein [Gordonia sp. HY442]|uniref:phage tail family protein n=1 Tax=Gordonia zhenghanii TaxID=2911516 RepID=UPI001F48F3E7|nr:phage tail family protein [Gordonia zhenghanii]MCF8605157.1 phage tail family protein [Gordonia zhenghanii]
MAAVLTDHTIVELISPEGHRVRISGAKPGTDLGAWLDTSGPDGLGSVEIDEIFDAAARQWGETKVGETMNHGEIDLPIFILGDSPDDFRRRREHFKTIVRRHELGWLAIYTNAHGWRWVGVKLGELKPAVPYDPRITRGAKFEMTLIVESPLARSADYSDSWFNDTGSGKGSVSLYPGPEWEAWPQFVIQGPGVVTIEYAGNKVTHMPDAPIKAGEAVLVNTDEARPTVRSSAGRNLWPLMKGQKYRHPIPPGKVTRVTITVTGGTTETAVYATCAWRHEGLL